MSDENATYDIRRTYYRLPIVIIIGRPSLYVRKAINSATAVFTLEKHALGARGTGLYHDNLALEYLLSIFRRT